MQEGDKAFTGSIPAIYDRYLGPLLFEPYAADMAERAARLGAKNILETAAGTGILTRALARKLPHASIVATDLNQAMLDYSAAKAHPAKVAFRQADAQDLPFDDHAFDAVLCQFGMMFLPDKARGYSQARRVLTPGGSFLFSVWDSIARNDLARLVTEGVAKVFPRDPPQFLPRTPYGYFDVDAIEDALVVAGFTHVAVESVVQRGRSPSARDVAMGLCQGSPLKAEIEARDKNRLEEATSAAAAAVAARFGHGAIDSEMKAFVIAAVR